ncbi:MAG: hypothetical protein ABIX28_25495 [Vicinamibacterales bacterium]
MDQRFSGLSTEELADIWYALGGAETRHPGAFSSLADTTLRDLNSRLGDDLAPFLEQRFRAHRLVDSREDAEANRKNAISGL